MARPVITDRELVRHKQLLIRARTKQYKRWAEQAKQQGVPLPEWARSVLDRAARTG